MFKHLLLKLILSTIIKHKYNLGNSNIINIVI